MAWQAWSDGQADILLAPLDAARQARSPPVNVSETPANEWSPAIAVDKSGRVHVAFDSYQAGNYDVVLRTREADGTLGAADRGGRHAGVRGPAEPGGRPAGRVWVAYEERTPNWGKDAENLLDGKGSSLYRASKVVVAVRRRRARARRARPGRERARRAQGHEQLPAAGRRPRRAGSGWPSATARRRSGATTP